MIQVKWATGITNVPLRWDIWRFYYPWRFSWVAAKHGQVSVRDTSFSGTKGHLQTMHHRSKSFLFLTTLPCFSLPVISSEMRLWMKLLTRLSTSWGLTPDILYSLTWLLLMLPGWLQSLPGFVVIYRTSLGVEPETCTVFCGCLLQDGWILIEKHKLKKLPDLSLATNRWVSKLGLPLDNVYSRNWLES